MNSSISEFMQEFTPVLQKCFSPLFSHWDTEFMDMPIYFFFQLETLCPKCLPEGVLPEFSTFHGTVQFWRFRKVCNGEIERKRCFSCLPGSPLGHWTSTSKSCLKSHQNPTELHLPILLHSVHRLKYHFHVWHGFPATQHTEPRVSLSGLTLCLGRRGSVGVQGS